MIYFLNHYLYDLNHTLYNVHSCGESPRPVPLPEPSKNLWTPKETKGSLLSSSYRTWYYCLALVGRVQKCQNQPRGGGRGEMGTREACLEEVPSFAEDV